MATSEELAKAALRAASSMQRDFDEITHKCVVDEARQDLADLAAMNAGTYVEPDRDSWPVDRKGKPWLPEQVVPANFADYIVPPPWDWTANRTRNKFYIYVVAAKIAYLVCSEYTAAFIRQATEEYGYLLKYKQIANEQIAAMQAKILDLEAKQLPDNYYWVYKTGHRPGCEAYSHSGLCYGILWQCPRCRRNLCQADGHADDNRHELCDNCWSETQRTEKK